MKIPSKNLVIDADIAQACGGGNATHPTATATRDFLQAVLTICHKTVMTSAIQEEWNIHQSSFARKWRRSMVAKKKMVVLNPGGREDIRQEIKEQDVSGNKKKAMLKDFHLIEAALGADHSIVSLDDKVRDLFSATTNNIADLRAVLWVNPVHDHEKVMGWLNDGAPIDGARWQQWRLGNHAQL